MLQADTRSDACRSLVGFTPLSSATFQTAGETFSSAQSHLVFGHDKLFCSADSNSDKSPMRVLVDACKLALHEPRQVINRSMIHEDFDRIVEMITPADNHTSTKSGSIRNNTAELMVAALIQQVTTSNQKLEEAACGEEAIEWDESHRGRGKKMGTIKMRISEIRRGRPLPLGD